MGDLAGGLLHWSWLWSRFLASSCFWSARSLWSASTCYTCYRGLECCYKGLEGCYRVSLVRRLGHMLQGPWTMRCCRGLRGYYITGVYGSVTGVYGSVTGVYGSATGSLWHLQPAVQLLLLPQLRLHRGRFQSPSSAAPSADPAKPSLSRWAWCSSIWNWILPWIWQSSLIHLNLLSLASLFPLPKGRCLFDTVESLSVTLCRQVVPLNNMSIIIVIIITIITTTIIITIIIIVIIEIPL